MGVLPQDAVSIGGVIGLQQHGQIGDLGFGHAEQAIARLLIDVSLPRERDVGDNAEDVLPVGLKDIDRLLVRFGEEDLGARAHAEQPLIVVDALRDQGLGLHHDLGVHHREKHGVELGVVLHEEDDLHAAGRVGGHIAVVFHVLDDGEKYLAVAEPVEDLVDGTGAAKAGEEVGTERLGCEKNHRLAGIKLLDPAAELLRVHVREPRHGEHDVEGAGVHLLQRLFGARHTRDARDEAQVEVDVLVEDHLGEAAVFLEDECVIEARDEQDLTHTVAHEIVKAAVVALVFGVEGHTRATSRCESSRPRPSPPRVCP